MRKIGSILVGLSLSVSGVMFAAAQEQQTQGTGPPKVLQIEREFLKPGKAGMLHDRSESNFVEAMNRAKWPTHYTALNSLSGPTRALYLIGYPSYEAWQKDAEAMRKDTALSAAFEKAAEADGELLSSSDQAVFTYAPDLSYKPAKSLANVQFMEITAFELHPGHAMDWRNLVKLYIDAVQKAGIDANWAMFQLAYGGGDEYLICSTDRSMGEIDKSIAESKKLRDALGEDGMKKIGELEASSIKTVNSELFEINPRQSYPPAEWVKENPSFWNPRPLVTSSKKPVTAKPVGPEKARR